MAKLVPFRSALVLGALWLFFWVLPQPATGCEICKYTFFLGFSPCRAVTENEVGSTICTNNYDPIGGFSCEESGTYCSVVGADGGGGGGTGGSGVVMEGPAKRLALVRHRAS